MNNIFLDLPFRKKATFGILSHGRILRQFPHPLKSQNPPSPNQSNQPPVLVLAVFCPMTPGYPYMIWAEGKRQSWKRKVSCIILYKPNEEKQNFWWSIYYLKKQWFVSFQNTAHDICLTEGDSTKKCLVSWVQKKGEAGLLAKKGESRESKVKDKHPGNSMPMFRIPNPLQDSILTGTWRKPSCLGVPFWGGVNTLKACFLFICNNRCKFAVRTLFFRNPKSPSTFNQQRLHTKR